MGKLSKYAIETATHNFPDIVELGDAFQVRKDNWSIAPMADISRSATIKRPTPQIVEKLGQMSLFEVAT